MSEYQDYVAMSFWSRLLKGALAGAIATVPMTLFMLAAQPLLPKGQHYALPPEIITEEVSQRANTPVHMNKPLLRGATLLSHFGYGAGMGALYAPLERLSFLPAFVRGTIFGVGVWAGSYLVLLPLLGFRVAGQREPGHRNLMMLVAHVVWGSTLGMSAHVLNRHQPEYPPSIRSEHEHTRKANGSASPGERLRAGHSLR